MQFLLATMRCAGKFSRTTKELAVPFEKYMCVQALTFLSELLAAN